MGSSESKNAQNLQYNHKKRQNHSIFGEVVLIQNKNSSKFYTLKTIKTEILSSQKSFQKLMALNQDHKQKYFVSIKQVDEHKIFLNPCSAENDTNILLDCIEVDIQNIVQSKYFVKFQQIELINIITSVLEGIITLQNQKLNVFPIYKKSVIMSTYKDEYRGQSLSKVIFKVIPLDLVKSDLIQIASALPIFPPQIQQYTNSQAKSFLLSQFTPKNHIYCLGMMILDLIYDQIGQNKVEQISFGDVIETQKQISKQKQIQVLENSNFSLKFKQIVKLMVENKQQNRIGLTSLYDVCKMMYLNLRGIKQNPYNSQNQLKNEVGLYQRTFNKKINKNKKRAISSVGLAQRQKQSQQLLKYNTICLSDKYKQQPKKQRNLSIDTRDTFFDMTNTHKLSICYQSNNSSLNPSHNPSPNHSKHQILSCQKNKIVKSIESTRLKQSEFTTRLSQNPECVADQGLKRKKPQRVYFHNGAFYEGQINDNSQFDGFGTLYYSGNQICYTGYWRNNKFHGFGYLFNINNSNQKLKNRQPYQNFTLSYRNFANSYVQKQRLWQHYEGEFKNDEKDGFGILFFVDGSKFEGQFVCNKVTGTGSFIGTDGKIVNGIWKDNVLVKQYD